MNQQMNQQMPQIDPSVLKNARDITCTCGSSVYNAAFAFKFISAIISPTGQAMVAPEQIFVCSKCGELLSIESTEEERAGVVPKDKVESQDDPPPKVKTEDRPDSGGNGAPKGTKLGIISSSDNN